jgi:ADP-heptose:LPS heptosyltransferase
MRVLKGIEQVAKRLFGAVAAVLLWRPFRSAPATARLVQLNRVLFVRIDDRVGEALLMTPAISAFKRRWPSSQLHLLVHPSAARVLDRHPAVDRLVPLGSTAKGLPSLTRTIRALRRERYEVVVDCGNWAIPSVSSALIARLAGPDAVVIGPAVWPASLFHTLSVEPRKDTQSEALQRIHLLSPLQVIGEAALSFRTPVVGAPFRSFLAQLGEKSFAVLYPGGRLAPRRAPPEAFAAAASTLLGAGILPVVAWGRGEEPVGQALVAKVPGARIAPATDLDELAALMQRALLTISNNTGPMHLSVALGTPTLGLFVGMETERWGHSHPPHRMIDITAEPGNELAARIAEEVQKFVARLRRPPEGSPHNRTSRLSSEAVIESPEDAPHR